MQSRLLLDVVIREGATILQLLPCEDQTLLIWGDAFLVLNLGLHIVDGVRGLDFQRDGLAREGIHKDLHSATESKDEVKRGLLLNIIVGEGSPILQLLASENQTLLVGRDAAKCVR
jgi:hypothetical protein